ncbi:MAG: DNA polymerase [Patescibacteria group bacterium]|nr:DNA polymerase [Patescibacteria group bacterium]
MEMEQKTKKFLIIDSNALIHRAYHALPPLTTKNGELVNAVYGFLLALLKAIKDLQPDYIAACFDVKFPTFRHKAFAAYKAKREKAPEELYKQISLVKEGLAAFNILVFEKEGFEADDLIGTLAKKAPQKQALPKVETVILSGDMDNLQLVDEQTKVFTFRKGLKDEVLYDIGKVKERYGGLEPSQLQDYRGLAGDQSDNIPGVSGIGQKTAIELLKEFGSLENLYDAIENEKPQISKIKLGVLQKLKDYKEQALISQQLAQIHVNVPVDFNLQDCLFSFDFQKAADMLKRFEFFSLVNRLPEQQLPLETPFLTGQAAISGKQPAGRSLFINEEQTKNGDIFSQIETLQKQGILSAKIAETEKEIAPLIAQMEKWGVKIDLAQINKLSNSLGKTIVGLQKQIFRLAKQKFNINSTQQLSEMLFDKMKISPLGLKKTPGGVVSTRETELEKLREKHPIAGKILDYREVFKLKTGFVDSLSQMVSAKDGRVHPHFHQLGTETGRLSCSDPNLQNIPVRGRLGRAVRQCFVPESGFEFLSADYSQVELRVASHLSGDKKMIKLFRAGEDVHTLTASEIFNKAKEKVSPKERQIAKTLNFAVLYGMGPVAFSQRAGIDKEKAREFIEKYFAKFSGIAQYLEETKAKAKEDGFSQTLFGRKRFLLALDSRDPRLRAQAERMAVNMPSQGAVADIVKMAMAELWKKKIINQKCRLLLQIHDELLFEIKRERIKAIAPVLKRIMEGVVALKVPLKVGISQGNSWGDLK